MPKVVSDQEKTARFRAFWTRSQTDRPLIGATIGTFPSPCALFGVQPVSSSPTTSTFRRT
jgi:hypothetical protein